MQQALLQQHSLYHPGLLAPPQVRAVSLLYFFSCDFDSVSGFEFCLDFGVDLRAPVVFLCDCIMEASDLGLSSLLSCFGST